MLLQWPSEFPEASVCEKPVQAIKGLSRYIRFVEGQQTPERKRRVDGKCTLWSGWKFNLVTMIFTSSVPVLNSISAGHEHVTATTVLFKGVRSRAAQLKAEFHCTWRTVGTFSSRDSILV